jgi:hypothetical protein
LLTPSDERRLLLSDDSTAVAGRAAIELSAYSEDSADLLNRCRQVMEVVLRHGDKDWPSLPEWRRELPEWFVLACAPEQSEQENQEWLTWWKSLPPDQQNEIEDRQPWALSEWLEWLRPSERTWYWLGAELPSPAQLTIWLDTPGSPAPVGALEWLLKASGATEIVEES